MCFISKKGFLLYPHYSQDVYQLEHPLEKEKCKYVGFCFVLGFFFAVQEGNITGIAPTVGFMSMLAAGI